ncbi:MAG: hypothetical protein V1701_02740 [Planctomycetota bacterium]
MGIDIKRCYAACCDKCGKIFSESVEEPRQHYELEDKLISNMRGAGWSISADIVLCPDCITKKLN